MAYRFRFAERRHANGCTAVVDGPDPTGSEIYGYALGADNQPRYVGSTGSAGDTRDLTSRLNDAKRMADICAEHADCACEDWRTFDPPKEGA